jgi:hypothetical protein
LPGRCGDRIYDVLSDEPVTHGETARGVLTRLAPTGRDVRCKASGRIHMFWRER